MKKVLFTLFAMLFVIAASCKKDDPKPAPSKDDPKTPPTEKVEVTSVTLDKITLTLEVGAEETLTATIAPENATDKTITWSSSDKAVATVDSKTGKITAVAAGETTITATSNNGKTATCTVTVMPAPKTIKGIDCVYIPAGTFLMGSPEDEYERDYNETLHSVTLTKGFWMSKFEITTAQYCAFLNAIKSEIEVNNDYEFYMTTVGYGKQKLADGDRIDYDEDKNEFYVDEGSDNYPMYNVSWYGANEFAKWIGGALPTEAQWEYACRGGQEKSLPFGLDDGTKLVEDMANFDTRYLYDLAQDGKYENPDGGYDFVVEVGSYSPNAWGLYDMHGNAQEWCSDWYKFDYYSDNQTDPTGPETGNNRIIRGGSYYSYAYSCRSAFRVYSEPNSYDSFTGFRIIFPE